MLSIVPLLNGGRLYETGAGGSAPKHVQQFVEEGHLRWDSLGEFLALGVAIEDFAKRYKNIGAEMLAKTLNDSISRILDGNIAPSRKPDRGVDNRGTHFYLARFWAVGMANQDTDSALKERFAALAAKLTEKQDTILAEIDATRGKSQDIGGYYRPDDKKVEAAMRPSQTLNQILKDFMRN